MDQAPKQVRQQTRSQQGMLGYVKLNDTGYFQVEKEGEKQRTDGRNVCKVTKSNRLRILWKKTRYE